jgi:hypothetical protein
MPGNNQSREMPATAGGLCFFHANPARARELGRIGGRKNRQQLPELVVPTAMTAAELSRLLSEALRDVWSNKLAPRKAAAMSQLGSVLTARYRLRIWNGA